MKRKLLGLLLCAAMSVTALAGCGQKGAASTEGGAGGEEKITLSIYAQYADDDTKIPYDYAVEALKEAYPNVELNLIIQAQDDGATLETLAATGQLPDIYQSNTNIINTFRETNQIMELDAVAESTGYLNKLMPSNVDLVYSEDGHIYCFPYAGNEYVLIYYNKALFEQCNLEVPKTYDDLMNCIEVFKANNIVPMEIMGEGWIYTALYDIVATRYNNGGVKALDEGTASVADEDYVKAAEKLSELAKAGLFQDGCVTTNYDEASAKFLGGEAAMFVNGQWYIPDAEAALGDDVDWMFYPSYDEASYEANKYAFAGGGSTSGFSVNPDSPNAELAAEVAEFMAEKYCEAKVLKRGTPLVALETGVTPETEYPKMMQKLSETIPSMTSTTKFSWGLSDTKFNESITVYAGGLVSGEYTAEEFVSDMTK